uniref:Diphthine--ammonia ligase n=1 Tax=Rhabditophanes sp. KR3021 TaxID=114890 RepID=A0AC35U659_9BILA
MKLVALISGGKDCIYNMMQCIDKGDEISCLVNMCPQPGSKPHVESKMFQMVGSEATPYIGQALGNLPLYRKEISGNVINHEVEYVPTEGDEVEDLFYLLTAVIQENPEIKGVSCGYLKSQYQKNRLQSICTRLDLKMVCHLWGLDSISLLDDMIFDEVNAIIIRIASPYLSSKFLGQSIKECRDNLLEVRNKHNDFSVAGEENVYDTFVLDCPIYKYRIAIITSEAILSGRDAPIPIHTLKLVNYDLILKPEE